MRSASEPSARAKRVWDRLSEWYGTRVAETYGPNPPRDWCRLVDRSSDSDLKRALATIRTKHPSHPPTLPEFEAALRPPPPVHRGQGEETPAERLVAYAIKTFRFTPQQMIAHWTFLYERRQWTDSQGRQRDELAECVGVVIPETADGGRRIRITVNDMLADQAAA